MSLTLDQVRAIIEADYAGLVHILDLRTLPLDIYEVNDDADSETTPFGTDLRNSTPGYTPSHLVLPQEPGDLQAWSSPGPTFPPTSWDPRSEVWAVWRRELWHEVVHQYQHQVLGAWDPKDRTGGHTVGWPDAVKNVATALGIDAEVLLTVL